MKALKCDVCGGYFDGLESISSITKKTAPNKLHIHYRAENGNSKDGCYSDICPDCYKAIKKALDDRRKITVNPDDDDLK